MKRSLLALALAGLVAAASVAAHAAAGAPKPQAQTWSFDGLFGTFDRGAVQRGFLVYNTVCSACHSLSLVAYRNLADIGFKDEAVKAIAAAKEVQDGPNDAGEMFNRPARPADRFARPFPNDNAARAANNGALPPDLSLITKARKGGADYLYALLTSYKEPPANFKMMEGMQYNEYFPGHQIAMAPPLAEGGVEYADGTKATVQQMAHDVATFLTWAAEPEMEARKRMGVKVLIFLIVLTAMLYALKRQIWKDLH
jgi:ubiquinol-cytochrome c reductase cytochrome c1 subunit